MSAKGAKPFRPSGPMGLIELGNMRDLNDRIHRIGEQLGRVANGDGPRPADGGRDQQYHDGG
jgi:hypothetical protein